MASLKTALRRKNANGGYDTILLHGDSTITYRPSGRTVEQDLAAYLPSVQNSDVVPESLTQGKLVVGLTKAWLGRLGEIQFSSTGDSMYSFKIGSYNGNGSTTRSIKLDFDPIFVFVFSKIIDNNCFIISIKTKTEALTLYRCAYKYIEQDANTTYKIVEGSASFKVGTSEGGSSEYSTNTNNVTYRYIALG